MQKKRIKRKLALLIAVMLMLQLLPVSFPVQAMLPDGTASGQSVDSPKGEAYDGIDIQGLVGEGLYFGAYDHASEMTLWKNVPGVIYTDYGHITTQREDSLSPILWRIMGEDNGDEALSLFSEYVIDAERFSGQGTPIYNAWNSDTAISEADYLWSYIIGWLNEEDIYDSFSPVFHVPSYYPIPDKPGFLSSFRDAATYDTEFASMSATTVNTYMLSTSGNTITSTGQSGASGEWYLISGWPRVQNNAYAYIPIGLGSGNAVFWNADGQMKDAGGNLLLESWIGSSMLAATLKNGSVAMNPNTNQEAHLYYWTRNPKYGGSTHTNVVITKADGTANLTTASGTRDAYGVRPIVKLDPTKIIMAYPIVPSGSSILSQEIEEDSWVDSSNNTTWNYTTGKNGVTNYKLTMQSDDIALGILTASVSSEAEMWTALEGGGTVNITAAQQDGDYLAYKIVEEDAGNVRNIVACGDNKGTVNSNYLTVSGIRSAEGSGTSVLGSGNYTLYVWTQKEDTAGNNNSSVHSFIGSKPVMQFAYALTLEVRYHENPPATTTDSDITGMPADQTDIIPSTTVTLRTEIPQMEKYQFAGTWNSQPNGGGISYTPGQNVLVDTDLDLYAQWNQKSGPISPPVPPPDPVSPEGPWELDLDNHYAYIIGYPDGTVRPSGNISREEVATIFFRLLEDETRNDLLSRKNNFSDVTDTRWSNTAISSLAGAGILRGYSNGTYQPRKNITRAEFASIASRFDVSYIDKQIVFTDTENHWAEDAISRAASLGWVQGYEDGSFRPDEYISRAEAATLINRVLLRIVKDESQLLPDMMVWPDNSNTNAWYYWAIQEATNSHDYERAENEHLYEIWKNIRDNPDWLQYER